MFAQVETGTVSTVLALLVGKMSLMVLLLLVGISAGVRAVGLSAQQCYGDFFSSPLCTEGEYIQLTGATYGLSNCSTYPPVAGVCCPNASDCEVQVESLNTEYHSNISKHCNGGVNCKNLRADWAQTTCDGLIVTTDYVRIYYQCLIPTTFLLMSTTRESVTSNSPSHTTLSTRATGSTWLPASTPGTDTPHATASTPGTDTPHASASTPGTDTPHATASTPGTDTPHASASTPGTDTPHATASTPGTDTPHATASTPGTDTPHASASTPGTDTPHATASTPGNDTPHAPASTPGTDTPHATASTPDSPSTTHITIFTSAPSATGRYTDGRTAPSTSVRESELTTAPALLGMTSAQPAQLSLSSAVIIAVGSSTVALVILMVVIMAAVRCKRRNKKFPEQIKTVKMSQCHFNSMVFVQSPALFTTRDIRHTAMHWGGCDHLGDDPHAAASMEEGATVTATFSPTGYDPVPE